MYKKSDTELLNNKLLLDQKIRRPSLNKIPKCNIASKNIPIPSIIYNTKINKKSLLPSKHTSTCSLKNIKNNPNVKRNCSGKNIPLINDRNFYSLIRNFKQIAPNNHNTIFGLKKRINSSEKSKSQKNEDSSYTSRKNINIDYMYNFKIKYNLLKQNIQKIFEKKIENVDIDITNKNLKEIIMKLKKILEKTNEQIIEKNIDKSKEKKLEINKKVALNKKLLDLYIEKYYKINEKLNEINNNNYVDKIINKIEDIQNEINNFEYQNKELLLNNNISNSKFNALTLPNINKRKNMSNINIKNEQEIIMDNQFQSKINEYKNQIFQEMEISRKIKDNEINLKKNEEILNNLLEKYNSLQNNYEKGIFIEETENVFNNNNINYNFNNLPIINNNIDMNALYEENLKEKERNKKKLKNELILIEKKRISKINKNNGFEPYLDKNIKNKLSLSKETRSRIITTENNSKFEDNHFFCLPFPPTKKKNLSCTNINSNGNENVSKNKKIKELILKNLDIKEKEEKTLINDTISSNKFKHIKLKPNFSFNNDYHLFKDEKIKKIPKLQSSVENKNTKIVNLYNNDKDKDKEELINESIQIDESSENIIDNNKINFNTLNNKSNNKININNNNICDKKTNKHELNAKNNGSNIKKLFFNKSNKDKEEEKKNGHSSIETEQREKVLNTIMYVDMVEQGSS